MPSEVRALMTKCELCKFSELMGAVLYCKRYPPNLSQSASVLVDLSSAKWTKVDKYEWCGEFKPKKEKKTDKS